MSKNLLTIFDTLYHAKTGAHYPVHPGKDGRLLKTLRGIYSDDDIELYMRGFFAIPDKFIEQSGYSVGVFTACLPKVIVWLSKGQQPAHDKALDGISRWVERQHQRSHGH